MGIALKMKPWGEESRLLEGTLKRARYRFVGVDLKGRLLSIESLPRRTEGRRGVYPKTSSNHNALRKKRASKKKRLGGKKGGEAKKKNRLTTRAGVAKSSTEFYHQQRINRRMRRGN